MQFFDLFWDSYLPRCGSKASRLLNSEPNFHVDWVKIIPRLNESQPTLNAAFTALVVARLGRTNHDLGLTHASVRLHSTALLKLQNAIRDKKTMLSDETVASVMLLGLYEASRYWLKSSRQYILNL